MTIYQIQMKTIEEPPNDWVSTIQCQFLCDALKMTEDWITTIKSCEIPEFINCQNNRRVIELENGVIQKYHYFSHL